MRKVPSDAEKAKILEYFLVGNSVNHTVFLMDYKFDSGDVCQVIREALQGYGKNNIK